MFKLSKGFVEAYKNKQPDWGPLGELTYKRSYAAELDDGSLEEWYQTCERVVNGIYELQRRHIVEHLASKWDSQKAQKSAQEMYRYMYDMKFLPPGRGLSKMGSDFVMNDIGGASVFNCFGKETRFITSEGVKSFSDYQDGDEITVLTHLGNWKRAVVKSYGEQQLQKIIIAKGRNHFEVRATSDHRWLLLDGSQTTSLKIKDKLKHLPPIFKDFSWDTATIDEKLYWCYGYVYGDGSLVKSNNRINSMVRLCKSEQRFEDRFTELGFSTSKPLSCGGDVFVYTGSYKKLSPNPKIDPPNLIRSFVAGYLVADGGKNKSSNSPSEYKTIQASDDDHINFIRNCFPVAGVTIFSECDLTGQITNFAKNGRKKTIKFSISTDLGSLEINKTCHINSFSVQEIIPDNKEKVWCLEVEDDHSFVLPNGVVTGNCSFVSTENIDQDFAYPFCFLLEVGMYGVGPGFDLRGAGKVKLKEPKVNGSFIVEDSREGWSSLIKKILDSYVGIGSFPENIDYSQIRPFGTKIKRFGGTASGPEALIDLVENIKKTLDTPNSYITSSQIVDLANYIGVAVVAGGSRRIAEIAFGDSTDKEYISLKDDYEKVKTHRWASNNSVFATIGMDYSEVAKHTAETGEPGYMWLENARKYSRMGQHGPDYKDMLVYGANPCNEQSLEDSEMCCLVESFPSRCENLAEYKRVLKFAYLYGKTTTLVKTPWPKTNAIMLKNRRIGLSQSGVLDNIAKIGFREHMRWCDEGYDIITHWDEIYSDWLCIPRSKKKTSEKPSGSVSLLCGARPGVHDTPAKSEYYIRRVEVLHNSPLVNSYKKAGYNVVQSVYKEKSFVIEIPVKEKNWKPFPLSIWPQLELAAQMQEHWADNQVSCTVYLLDSEKDQLPLALSMYETRLKGISFLPYNNSYEQAPYEAITKEKYEELIKNIKPVNFSSAIHEVTDKFCDSDVCQI